MYESGFYPSCARQNLSGCRKQLNYYVVPN